MPLDPAEVLGILSTFQSMRLQREQAGRQRSDQVTQERERATLSGGITPEQEATFGAQGFTPEDVARAKRPLGETQSAFSGEATFQNLLDRARSQLAEYDIYETFAADIEASNPARAAQFRQALSRGKKTVLDALSGQVKAIPRTRTPAASALKEFGLQEGAGIK